MNQFDILGKTVMIDDNYIEYRGQKIKRDKIYDWELYVGTVNFSLTAFLRLKTPNAKLHIDCSSTFTAPSKQGKCLDNLSRIMTIVIDKKVIDNFFEHASNKIKNEGYFKFGNLKFYPKHVQTGWLFPLKVFYRNASITTTRYESYKIKETNTYLNDGLNNSEKKISSHLTTTTINRMKMLIEYMRKAN